ARFIILDGIAGGRLGLVNVYAPNSPREWSALWEALLRELPRSCRWVMFGDMNMAEKSSACGRMLPSFERQAFEFLKLGLNVEEPPLSPDSLQYSWDNFRHDGARVMARLDRAYLFRNQDASSSATVTAYCILRGCTLSDHHLVQLELQL
ncbi:hypothetical protein KC19_VG091900, partial [Ceratodon purpureus]